jgi:YtkA-like
MAVAVIFVLVLHGGCAVPAELGLPSGTSSPSSAAPPAPTASPVRPTPAPSATPSPNVQEGVHSENGTFVGTWASDPRIPPINVVHEWVLHIETPGGDPVVGAAVSVNGDMPAHGHGMPTQPQVTADLGGGDYLVEGMSFQMGGFWIIDVTITAGGLTDRIHFDLDL